MNKSLYILSGFLFLLLLATLWWGRELQAEVERLEAKERSIEVNEKVIEFSKSFITLVLRADGEVDFDKRFQLENMVRNIGDQEIFDAWKAIPESVSETDAQKRVLDLLEILVGKISTRKSAEDGGDADNSGNL